MKILALGRAAGGLAFAALLIGGCAALTDSPVDREGAAKSTIVVGVRNSDGSAEDARDPTRRRVDISNATVDLVNVLRAQLRLQNWKVDSDGPSRDIDFAKKSVSLGGNQQALSRLITAFESVSDEDFKKRGRNQIVGEIVFASDGACGDFLRRLRSDQVGVRLATDALGGGLATWSSLAAPLSTAKLLGGLSALSLAEGSSVDRNVYAQTAAELIADEIVKLRVADRVVIESHMTSKSYADWPLTLAIADAVNYHRDCSAGRGLAQMREVLVARESTIAAIRTAANQVYAAGGDQRQIIAVLTALGPDQVTASLAGGSTELAGAWRGDLDAANGFASDCLSKYGAGLRGQKPNSALDTTNDVIFDATGLCQATKPGRRVSGAGPLDGNTDWGLQFKVLLDGLVKSSPIVCSVDTSDATKGVKAWEDCIDAGIAKIRAEYDPKVLTTIEQAATIRSVAASRLDNWRDSETNTTLAADIVALASLQPAGGAVPTPSNLSTTVASDPVMVKAAQTVMAQISAPISNTSARSVAQFGRAAEQQAYTQEIGKTKS